LTQLWRWRNADELATDGRGWSVNLDIFRVVFLSAASFTWAIRNLSWIVSVMPGLPGSAWSPVSFYRVVPFALLTNASFAETLAIANLLCIVLGIIGWRTRWSICGATLLSLYLFGLTENQGKIDHMHHLIWFMALLAAGPSGRFLSIDSLLNAKRNADAGSVTGTRLPFDALWTLRYVWILMGLLYLIPGLAKLERTLVAHWASASNLENVFWRKWLETSLFATTSLPSIRIDLWPSWLIGLSGIGVIAFEIGFLFVVLFRRLRAPAAFAGLGFHIGNGLILQIWFTTLLPAYVALIDWCAFGRWMSAAEKRSFTVLYDGQCRFCRRTVAILKSLDLFDVIQPKQIEIFSVETSAGGSSILTHEEMARDLHVIDGETTLAGYDAYEAIANRIALLWPVAIIMRWPLVAARGRKIYRRIADSRHCSIERVVAKPSNNLRPKRLVLVVGTGLVVLQFFIGFVMYAYTELSGQVAKLPRPARKLVVDVGQARPVWPFTYYPTFSYATGSDAVVWEARWILDGREVRVSPQAYDNAFHNSGAVWSIVSDSRTEDQAHSIDLVRTLWNKELPNIRQSVTGVRIYQATYHLGPASQAPGAIVSERLLYTFRSDAFSQ
jgi:predicted DCC family thiol-disulfide oxidoreductase YuxK